MMDNKTSQSCSIAILSMQRIVNFGSVLQAYSLRELLREITGAEVTFLEIEQEPSLYSRRSVPDAADYESYASYPAGILQRGKRWCIAQLSRWNKRLIRKFMDQELALDLAANQEEYDWVVIGSDEVFNHKKGVCLQLHGDVRQGRHIISYAASCGSALPEDILAEDWESVRRAMGNFVALSVRDDATERYVSSFYDGAVCRHLDPVLVGDLYRRPHRKVWLKNYMLIYAYGQRIRTKEEIQAIQNFAKKKGLKTVAMGGSQFWCDLYIPVSPFRLLDYFYYADYIVTDTFHGSIFSVINQKKFATICRKTNSGKLHSLLQDLGLTERMVIDVADLDRVLTEEIDYAEVEKVLARERARSRDYLKNSLGIDNNDCASKG